MRHAHDRAAHVEWRLPEQHFEGTPEHVAADVDRLIATLMACRLSLRASGAVPARGVADAEPSWKRILAVFVLAVAVVVRPAGAIAQTAGTAEAPQPASWRDTVFGVTFEGFYEWNANDPTDRVNALRAYDTRAATFGVQQLAAVVELPPSPAAGRRFGLRADVQFGQATETVQGNPTNEPRPDVYRNIWQAYGTYVAPVGQGLQVDFGKFASNLGYETNYAKDNQAFSRSYLFSFLPYYHMGLRASLPVGQRVTLMATLTNGIQQTEEFNGFKSVQVSATARPWSRLTGTLNYYAGREQPDPAPADRADGVFRVLDAYATLTITPRLSVSLDVNRTTNEPAAASQRLVLDGLGAYARLQVTARASVGARYERIDDDGLFGGVKQVLQELTITAEHRLADGLLVRAEYRHDWSDVASFPSSGGTRDRQPTALIGAVWWVGSKSGAW